MTEERKEFESYLQTHSQFTPSMLNKLTNDRYIYTPIEAHWETWQAARQSNQRNEAVTAKQARERSVYLLGVQCEFNTDELLVNDEELAKVINYFTSPPQTDAVKEALEKVIEIIKRNANKYDECYATVIIDEIGDMLAQLTQPESEGK